jgi:Tfp pilus assembly protein PilF
MPLIADKHYIKLGDKAYEAGQLIVAENNYSRAIKLNPENTEAYYNLGRLYQELADDNKAIENYKVAWKGNKIEAADELASLYFKQRNYQQADEWLELALETPMSLLHKDKQVKINQKEFNLLSRLASQNPQEFGNVENLGPLMDDRTFAFIKNKATLINDKQFELLIGLANFYLKIEKYADSARRLFLGFALTQNDKKKQATILAYQGWVQLKQASYSDAETQLAKAIALNNELASAHCLLAQV